MQMHEYTLRFEGTGKVEFDLVIEGLGWIGLGGKGLSVFQINVPNGVKCYLRDQPLNLWEFEERKLKKHTGKTFNADSKINRDFV